MKTKTRWASTALLLGVALLAAAAARAEDVFQLTGVEHKRHGAHLDLDAMLGRSG